MAGRDVEFVHAETTVLHVIALVESKVYKPDAVIKRHGSQSERQSWKKTHWRFVQTSAKEAQV